MVQASNQGHRLSEHQWGQPSGEAPAGGVLEAVQEKAQNVWESTTQGAQQAAEMVTETAGDLWSDVSHFMKRYPMATFCMGLGLGALLMGVWRGTAGSSGMIRGMEESGRAAPYPFSK